jgi:hypothetical protein
MSAVLFPVVDSGYGDGGDDPNALIGFVIVSIALVILVVLVTQ